MSALFETGFFVRVPAWHRLGTVLDGYPGRDEAFKLAGHDYVVVEHENGDILKPIEREDWDRIKADPSRSIVRKDGKWFHFGSNDGKKGLRIEQPRADGTTGPLHGNRLEVVNSTFEVIPNEVPWDILDVLLQGRIDGKTLNYETGAVLDGGAECFVTAYLDLPFQVTGDDSEVYPYVYATWRHDGLGALHVGGTSVRIVCANTLNMAKDQSEKSGHAFTFKHTKNVLDRIEDAKMALQGITAAHSEFAALAEELGALTFTEKQVEEFVHRMIPDVPAMLTSERVAKNIHGEREKVFAALASPTVPEAHKATGWGLYNGAVEFFDHLRKPGTAVAENSNAGIDWRDKDGNVPTSYVRRSLYSPDKFKEKLIPLIRECADIPR